MKFIEDIRSWYKLWSVRLAALVGIIATVLTANPQFVFQLLALVPDGPARWAVGAFVGALVFGVPTLTRLLQQPVKEKPDGQ